MRLGIVTYNIAADWDCDTIISNCGKVGLEGVELRTTHAHKVEVALSKTERQEIKKKFNNSSVNLVGLGSAFEYHSADPEELKKNIEGTKEYIILADDVGAEGIKVRPNNFPERVSKEKTIEQIGKALKEIGEFADNHKIKINLEVHGMGTMHPPYIKQMIDIADHHNVFVCWNCNSADMDESGSIDKYFEMLKDKINLVHTHDFYEGYPYERLFYLLKKIDYNGFCLAEIPGSSDAERVLKYYKMLFDKMKK